MNSTEKQLGAKSRQVYVQILIEHNVKSAIKEAYAFLDEWALNDLLWGMSKDELIDLHNQISNGYNSDKLVFEYLAEYIGRKTNEEKSLNKVNEIIKGDKSFIDIALECSAILSEQIVRDFHNEVSTFFSYLYSTFSNEQIEDLIQSLVETQRCENKLNCKTIQSRNVSV